MISLTMIVKNEERTLARCLDSVRAAVDEIVIVDTGSTDRTKEIAAGYGARVFDFAWQNDFSVARQFALDQATGDWVIWLDADDVVEGAEHIRGQIAAVTDEVNGLFWRYVTSWTSEREPNVWYWRERCVRNNGSFRWGGIVHEVLVPQTAVNGVHVESVSVWHHPEREKPGKSTRNLEILSRQFEASGGELEPRMLFYLGRELSDNGHVERAIEILELYETRSKWNDERYHAKLLLANLYAIGRQFDRSTEIYYDAMRLFPLWPNAYFGLAAMAYFRQEWRLIVHWTDCARALPPPDTMLFVNQHALNYEWIIHYTNGLFQIGRVRDALSWTEHALAINPTDAMHLNNQDYFKQLLAADDSNGVCLPDDAPAPAGGPA